MNVKGTAPKAYIEVTGGELNVTGTLTMASGGGTDIAWLTQSGGKVTVGGQLQMATAAVSGAGEVIVNLDGGEMTIKNATPLTFGGGTPNYFDFDGGKLNLKGTWNFTSLTAIANSDFRVGGVAATSWDLNFNPVTIDTVPYTQITVSTGSSPFETWANGTFDPSLTQKLPGDNQDGDSLTNLQEFAFGTQPTVSTGPIVYVSGGSVTPGTPQVFPNVPASGMYSMVFGRRADYVAAGLTYTVQFSAGLGVWVDNNDGTNPPVQVATDGTINAMSVPFVDFILTPSGMQKPTFARVKVELAD
jgi:hypothetical protein